MIVLAALVFSLFGTFTYLARLQKIANTAPRIPNFVAEAAKESHSTATEPLLISGRISVIIPAYNEADNIADCIISVLGSSSLPVDKLEIWVVDDQSTDATLAIAQTLQTSSNDPRLQVLAGQPRPAGQVWMGKNWACTQAVKQAFGDFILFLDADVRLKFGAIESASKIAANEQIDLLTCWPTIVCGCLPEWLVQPWMASLLAAGFDFTEVNDPTMETAFAVGPFMLFRRSAYEQLGGHQAVASEVVEDVELARRLKQKQMKLKYALGHDLAAVRMYRSWAAVWEGWTKNWYLGSRRDLTVTLYAAVIAFVVCTVPWLGFAFVLAQVMLNGLNFLELITVIVALLAILLQIALRQTIDSLSAIPPRYWWLTGLGGVLVTAIIIASVVKTETGWGWTWRGRSLQLPS